jgi:hypothetical protein
MLLYWQVAGEAAEVWREIMSRSLNATAQLSVNLRGSIEAVRRASDSHTSAPRTPPPPFDSPDFFRAFDEYYDTNVNGSANGAPVSGSPVSGAPPTLALGSTLLPNFDAIFRGGRGGSLVVDAGGGGGWEEVLLDAPQDMEQGLQGWEVVEEALMRQAERESWELAGNQNVLDNAQTRAAASAGKKTKNTREPQTHFRFIFSINTLMLLTLGPQTLCISYSTLEPQILSYSSALGLIYY